MADPSDTTEWTQNDTFPALRLALSDDDGLRSDLSDAELIRFIAKPSSGASIVGTALPIEPPDGDGFNLSYTWGATDLAVPATYRIEVEVTWDSGTTPPQVESWSSAEGDLPVLVVRPQLG